MSPGVVEVTNESHETPAEHQYTVSIDDVTAELMACTCPHHVHRNAFCKHMTAVETATDDGTLDAFPLVNSGEGEDGPHVTGPHLGFNKYGNADHRYWRCEECGQESTDKRVLSGDFGDCC